MAGGRPANVLPGLAGETWDDLRFAYLRRLFRGQIRPRGALEQWDVAHAQMREAILSWLADRGATATDLHAALARHLTDLPADDPLRETETMRHLLGAGQLEAAAAYYATPDLLDAAAAGATRFWRTPGQRNYRRRLSARSSPICSPFRICLPRSSVCWPTGCCSICTTRSPQRGC